MDSAQVVLRGAVSPINTIHVIYTSQLGGINGHLFQITRRVAIASEERFDLNPSGTTILRTARLGEDHMNKDEISGKVDQVVGKVKQGVGEAIGNQKVANQGVIDQAKGAAKETWGNAKDAANQVRESQRETAEEKADNVRHKISQSVEDAKKKAKTKIDEFKDRHSG